jgi:tetratricopeptide (TPR) repeat protein
MMFAALFVEEMVGLIAGKELDGKPRLARLISLGLLLAFSAAVVNMPWPRWNDRPLRAAMRYNLGIALAGRGELDSAAREFEASLIIKDFYPEARFWLGKVLADSGKVRKAADEFEKSIALAPGYAPAHYELSLLYLKMSKEQGDEYYKKARAEMETAHRLAPGVFPKPK